MIPRISGQSPERNAQKRKAGKRGRPLKVSDGHAHKAKDALANLLATIGRKGLPGVPPGLPSVPVEQWRDEFYQTAMVDTANAATRRSAFWRAAAALDKAGIAARSGEFAWLTRPEEELS